ncbi:MAG: chromosome segregation protein SMC [Coxiellaceae bacterium]|nr:chromosome segregation protein SMC [Coxiellaceae bacterium]
MYLKQIKLAGFKSFVDPTIIPIRNPLNAIVGPNGCGKSNIVDAIRWVIGESSAKQLRGQSMSDVIFNGTATRQPLGRAMVELLFDNSDHKLTGEYAAYTEICIRREVEREGQSSYFLNGTRCRRKDITDIFLGTGLGPRSYSIIEQGMISRLIEAKPEELRVFFEEAAGISKYKERRRETENRMRHTNENLDRVNDLCEELERQLGRLQRQAKSAEKYKIYKQQEEELQLQLKGLHWQQLQQDLQSKQQQLTASETEFEQARAQSQQLETELDKSRVSLNEYNQQQSDVQKDYYGSRAEVSRVEQRISHLQQQAQQWHEELETTGSLWQELSDSAEQHSAEREELEQDIEQLSPQLVSNKQQVDQLTQQLQQAEEQQQTWQESWDQFQGELSKTHKQVEVEKNTLNHLRQQRENLQRKQQQLQQEHGEIDLNELQTAIDRLKQDVSSNGDKIAQYEAEMSTLADQIAEQRDQINQQNQQLDKDRQQLQALKGRQASLDALQQSALHDDDSQVKQWLSDQGLQNAKRLGETITVESGWEAAVEAVMFDSFQAVCVDDTISHLDALASMTGANVSLTKGHSTANAATGTLASKVKSNAALPIDLNQVLVAADLAQAKQQLGSLQPGQSVITPQGVWLSTNWVKLVQADDAKRGVLQREQELKQISTDMTALEQGIEQNQNDLDNKKQQLSAYESQRDQLQSEYQQCSKLLSQYKSELSSNNAQYQSKMQRLGQLADDIEQVEQQLMQTTDTIQETESSINVSSQSEQQLQDQREHLLNTRDTKRQSVLDCREQLQQARQSADEVAIRLATSENQLLLLQQTLDQDRKQIEQLDQRKEHLQEQLQDENLPLEQLQEELQQHLSKNINVEQQLNAVQKQLEECRQNIQELDRQRHQVASQVQQQQNQLQQMRMDKQTLVVKQASIVEQLEETEHTIEQIIPSIPEEATIAVWADDLLALEKRISRLGPINLAAIEEYDEVNERKTYLDEQQADLREALEALEGAIHKIDKETRANFKTTFDNVSANFKKIFPKVFGGGSAELALMDEDMLTAGVQVKAQPPGKRNSTIHMLSGGEKALTAIALVFSLFQLNPAPFCVLDEVDAPLDDLNVGRYCALIKEMVGQTQFLVISHNKVTIESADSLLGVTQQEAGVSRMVAVDIEQAVAMAEA